MYSALPSPTDPISRERNRLGAVHIAGSVLTLGALAWALWPLHPKEDSAHLQSQAKSPKAVPAEVPSNQAPYPAEAFRVVLWPPTASELADQQGSSTTQVPTKPPNYILVAILSETQREGEEGGGVREAVFYDPDEDRLQTVGLGDRLGRFEVSRVDAEVVQLSDGKITHELRLRNEETLSQGKDRG